MTTPNEKMSQQSKKPDPNRELLCAVLDEGQIALVRVQGRGSFGNSSALRDFALRLHDPKKPLRFIVDLNKCESMDSTFMGVLAGIALRQIRTDQPRISIVNPNEQCFRLLKNLGLAPLIDLRTGPVREVERGEGELKPTQSPSLSRAEQICLTLQAHHELVKLDNQNEVRFQAVIEYLEKSLEDEGGCPS